MSVYFFPKINYSKNKLEKFLTIKIYYNKVLNWRGGGWVRFCIPNCGIMLNKFIYLSIGHTYKAYKTYAQKR